MVRQSSSSVSVVSSSSSSRRVVQSRSKDDVIERFFSQFEVTLCPYILTENSKVLNEDAPVLDYVFESVESFTCAEDAPHLLLEEAAGMATDDGDQHRQPHTLQRDNSLVEPCPQGFPVTLETRRRGGKITSTTTGNNKKKIQPLGKEGDLIDYVFDRTEAYACGPEAATGQLLVEPATTQRVTPRKVAVSGKHRKMPRKPTRSSCEHHHHHPAEDEVQLYFRPQKRH